MNALLIEVIIVGIATAILGALIIHTTGVAQLNRGLIGVLFLTGALIHILAEASGINKWYCGNGYACKQK